MEDIIVNLLSLAVEQMSKNRICFILKKAALPGCIFSERFIMLPFLWKWGRMTVLKPQHDTSACVVVVYSVPLVSKGDLKKPKTKAMDFSVLKIFFFLFHSVTKLF